ncbi:protein lin-52 homolog [Copidosoma floridanum]|uniref:protein lin-52 homolog n=1 Tax=Copidosoma floridanum TaxID=29053 RepID=UPI0006C9B0EE|nr:protein lin-52 homolog [Copidosoma floridanum]XP_014208117.1 protein lin-52 homolog [Copidosoma floridanum]
MDKEIIEETEIERSEIPTAEESLISLEKMDRASPDLWPEHAMTKFVTQNNSSPQIETPLWSTNFTAEDLNHLHQLGNLTVHELVAEVKKLHDTAYQLGLEEAKEMTRGKFLNIFKQESKE